MWKEFRIEVKRGRKQEPAWKRNTRRKTSSKAVQKKSKKSRGILKSIVYAVFICIFVILIACLGVGAGMYAAITQEMNEMNISELALTRSSIVYYNDDNGNSIEAATLFSDGNCIWIESNEIADVMKDAIVSIEDERFYDHNGVDIKRTTGAVLGYVREMFGKGTATYGGSTITQQVIKNITQEKDRTATRKIKEMMRAVAIEKQLSKDEILTMYLNIIYLANNCYGIEAASEMYFDKNASELELHEAALIAGITQKPSYYDPLKNPENAVTKRNTVLAKMYELGKISQEEYNAAKEADIGLKGEHRQAKSNIYSYFIDSVINDVIRDLQKEKGYTESFATQQVYSGGLKIYTTMDYDVQEAIEDVFENNSNFSGGARKAQAAMVIIDPTTGQIKGLVGGKGTKTDSRGLNRATQTTRQPGSSIKPLSVYAPAIEKGVITPTTRIVDEPIKIKNWEPKNSYSGFKGGMTVKKAVEISANIPAVKIVQNMGVNVSFDYVKNKFGLSTIEDSDKDLSPMALGGLTNGVTVRDMAAAYAVFANNGNYIEPYSYTKVLDATNRVLLENKSESKNAVSASTAYIITDMLYGVVNNYSGTGKLAKFPGMAIYGKTGTTNNDYDKWFVGYTKYYVGAVWFGFDTPASIRNAGVTNNISAKLWKLVMQKVHDGLEPNEILPGDNLVSTYICPISGDIAASGCEGTMQYFEKGTEPQKYCSQEHAEGETFEEMSETGGYEVITTMPPEGAQDSGGREVGDFIPVDETQVGSTTSVEEPTVPPEIRAPIPVIEDNVITLE